MTTLDLTADIADLVQTICDVESVSGNEGHLADLVEAALRAQTPWEIIRDGDCVIARSDLGRERRVVVAGHLDTVPLLPRPDNGEPNFPTWRTTDGDTTTLHGRGTVDMKGGVAVALACAATIPEPAYDVTYIFYDNEEVEASRNGLLRLSKNRPDLLDADFAVLGEPTSARIEGGCNGTIRLQYEFDGVAAHSARAWKGDNAIHKAHELLKILADYEAKTVTVDGLEYRESLSAVHIEGGIAGNVIPDTCTVRVNYRFAPDKTPQEAADYIRDLTNSPDAKVVDEAPGARPGLDDPLAADFVARTGHPATAKFGWTDVSRFSALETPAVNYGPGDSLLAHRDDERCDIAEYYTCLESMKAWLSGE